MKKIIHYYQCENGLCGKRKVIEKVEDFATLPSALACECKDIMALRIGVEYIMEDNEEQEVI